MCDYSAQHIHHSATFSKVRQKDDNTLFCFSISAVFFCRGEMNRCQVEWHQHTKQTKTNWRPPKGFNMDCSKDTDKLSCLCANYFSVELMYYVLCCMHKNTVYEKALTKTELTDWFVVTLKITFSFLFFFWIHSALQCLGSSSSCVTQLLLSGN